MIGDVGQLQPDGRYTIIDRCKNIFKLAQGEYVCPEKIESTLLSSRFLSQIFVHGDARASHVVAVVVPTPLAIAEVVPANSLLSSLTSLPSILDEAVTEGLVSLILADLRVIGEAAKLQPYEIPHGLLISLTPFTASNQLLTPNLKISRSSLTKHFRTQLLALYGYPDVPIGSTTTSVNDTKTSDDRRTGGVDLLKTVSDILGVGELKKSEALRRQAPIDSFSAVRMSNRFEELFKVKVPIATLLAEGTTLEDIERMLATSTSTSSPSSPTSSSTSNNLVDFVAESTSQRLRDLIGAPPKSDFKWSNSSNDMPPVWFVTGATGFLGAHIIAELLERASSITRVVLLTRDINPTATTTSDTKEVADDTKVVIDFTTSTNERCMARVVATLKTQQRWSDSFASRISVVVGDLSQPRFGLTDEVYEKLSNEITNIIHNGAHVNHAMTYLQLKLTNVDSLLHAFALSIHKGRRVPISYVSTASAMTAPTQILSPAHLRLANGYSQTKWVSERLTERFVEEYLVPVIIFRPGAVTGHSITGACNIGDFVNRVVCSAIQLGIAPPMRTRVSMVPVDFVASSIVALSLSHLAVVSPSSKMVVPSYTLTLPASMLWTDIAEAIRGAGYMVHTLAIVIMLSFSM
jgi:fatty acid CoA ligase FadD9